MRDRVCIVTGATAGMGKATATALAREGATVVLVARNEARGNAVRDEIQRQTGNPRVDVLFADLASQQAIHRLVDAFRQRYARLDVLINNAGGIFFNRQVTPDGLEMTFAVNHLAYFLLTTLLQDVLIASAPARVINISSNAERFGTIAFDDLQSERRYRAFPVYAQTKLANLLFTYELARRLEGTGVTVNAVRPGPVATNFGGGGRGLLALFPWIFRVIGKRPEDGARSAIELATSPAFEGVTGRVFYDGRELTSSPQSHDRALQQRLWQVSETLTRRPGAVLQVGA